MTESMRLFDPIEELVKHMPEYAVSQETLDYASEMIEQKGEAQAAVTLGFDTKSYERILLGGRILMGIVCGRACKTLIEYLKKMEHRLNKNTITFMQAHLTELQALLDKYEWTNYRYDYFSGMVMSETYLAKAYKHEKPCETPCLTFLRVAVQQMFADSIKDVKRRFKDYALGLASPATPTIFNAGFENPQMSSCFVGSIEDDLHSIYDVLKNAAIISKNNGGFGCDASLIRHSEIGHVGMSNGLIPMLKVYDETFAYVDQGGGLRKGAATMFTRTHHIDVFDFVSLTDNIGDQHERVHTINPALWTSWLFWERVRSNGKWTLFCPARSKSLNHVYCKEFNKRYLALENDQSIKPHHKKIVNARDLLKHVVNIMMRSGRPYITSGDSFNRKSAHAHIGPIRSSNLCQEIGLYSDEKNINVCNLSSINLSAMAKGRYTTPPISTSEAVERVNFQLLGQIAWRCVKNINRVIDHNFYPLDEDDGETLHRGPLHKTNKRFRAIGLGLSGMAELFASIDLAYVDPVARSLDEFIAACIYFNALASSVQLSILEGPNDVFKGSTFSEGKLQFDLWQDEYIERWGRDGKSNPCWKFENNLPADPKMWKQTPIILKDKYGVIIDTILPTWEDLKRCIILYGLRNSMLTSFMPTASTAKGLRNSESREQTPGNIYSCKLLAGNYVVMNRFMYYDMRDIGLWNDSVRQYVIASGGRLTGVTTFITNNLSKMSEESGGLVPNTMKEWLVSPTYKRLVFLERKYKTMFEISLKEWLTRTANVGKYVDQSQSTNWFLEMPNKTTITAGLSLADYLGLKTSAYYLRTNKAFENAKLTVDPSIEKEMKTNDNRNYIVTSHSGSSQKQMMCDDHTCCSS